MTLVVARRVADEIVLLSDTRVYDPKSENARPQPESGLVKSVVLGEGVALAFANSPDLAKKAVSGFPRSSATFRSTIEYFSADSGESGVDYILAFAGPRRL